VLSESPAIIDLFYSSPFNLFCGKPQAKRNIQRPANCLQAEEKIQQSNTNELENCTPQLAVLESRVHKSFMLIFAFSVPLCVCVIYANLCFLIEQTQDLEVKYTI